jgi:hypothetical protein
MFRARFGRLGVAITFVLISGCSFCFSTNSLFRRDSSAAENTCCSGQTHSNSEGPMLDGMIDNPSVPANPGCVPLPQGTVPQLAPAPRLVPQAEAATQPYTPNR